MEMKTQTRSEMILTKRVQQLQNEKNCTLCELLYDPDTSKKVRREIIKLIRYETRTF